MPSREGTALAHLFAVPLLHEILLYAPLHSLAAIVDYRAAGRILADLTAGKNTQSGTLGEIVARLLSSPRAVPAPRRGDLAPDFLGLIPSRACNLACGYCGFLEADGGGRSMDLDLARTALNWYLELASRTGARTAEIHFFGGEPFCAPDVVDFAYYFARLKGAELGCSVRFEVATNGVYGAERARWLADSFDSVILSLDGPAGIQDRHRHRRDGSGSSADVSRTAAILSEGTAEFSVRSCVTDETAGELPALAAWLCSQFRPVSVAFEPVQPTEASASASLFPPDPWTFARQTVAAARVLEAHGVQHVYAAADVSTRRVSFCPVGRDVPIVAPDGSVSACYLQPWDWEAQGLDLRLGRVDNGAVRLDEHAIEATRRITVWNKPLCGGCFCRWHCAGGCHVNHQLPETPGAYDTLCIQTRIIGLRNLLKAVDRDDLALRLLDSEVALQAAVLQPSDVIDQVRFQA